MSDKLPGEYACCEETPCQWGDHPCERKSYPAADRERIYTKADAEAMCEIAVTAVREPLMSDRTRLVEALRGVMGLVQLLASAHDDQATKNHRYVNAEALLRALAASLPAVVNDTAPPRCLAEDAWDRAEDFAGSESGGNK